MFRKIISCIVSLIVSVFTFFGIESDLGRNPLKTTVDMSKFSEVWSDEFDGDKIDTSKWNISQSVDSVHWGAVRKGGYWHKDMLSVRDGELIISADYKKDVTYGGDYKDGYYSAYVTTNDSNPSNESEPDSFLYGYFETRCKLPSAQGLWPAFWMMNKGVYNVDGSGVDGTEIDIFEGFYFKDVKRFKGNKVSMNLHYDGYNDAHKYIHVGKFVAPNDLYNDYNTFGLEWNENEYIFYINGRECTRSTGGGVSKNPEFLILSIEVAGENGIPHGNGDITKTPAWPAEFAVDYVRVYQYNTLLKK